MQQPNRKERRRLEREAKKAMKSKKATMRFQHAYKILDKDGNDVTAERITRRDSE